MNLIYNRNVPVCMAVSISSLFFLYFRRVGVYFRRVGVYFCLIGFLSLCQTLVYLIFQKSSRKKDKEKQTCKGCNESFNFTKRKHHCKSCGAVSTDWIISEEMRGHGERSGAEGGIHFQSFIW